MQHVGILQRLFVFGGIGIALTFGALMVLPYGLVLSTVFPSDAITQATPRPTQGENMKIFILDDFPDSGASTLKGTFEDNIPGIQVRIFSELSAMLASVEIPKIIILDGDLGDGIFGWTLKGQIEARWPGVKLIGWSDYTNRETKITAEKKFAEAGIEFAGKSYDMSTWLTLLK